jgi:hypothetical protein
MLDIVYPDDTCARIRPCANSGACREDLTREEKTASGRR